MTQILIASLAALVIVLVGFYLLMKYDTGEEYMVRYLKDGEWHEERIVCWDDGTTTARDWAELYAYELSPTYNVTKVNDD